MNAIVVYEGVLYKVPYQSYEESSVAYERAWWIASQKPTTIKEFDKLFSNSCIYVYEKYQGGKC